MKIELLETHNAASADMPEADFRRFGYEIVDWIADYFSRIDELPVLSMNSPNELKNSLPPSAPEKGEDFGEILNDVERLILPALAHWNHPNFHGLFASSASAVGIFGEMLAAAFDQKAMLWRTSPASTELEEKVLDWLRQMMDLPDHFEGIIYDTASVSTFHAIAAARERLNLDIREKGMIGRGDLPQLILYCSEQAHSSIDKAAFALGLGQKAVRKIPTDACYRLEIEALRRMVEEDKRQGHLPFCVAATAGTTSTAAVDPLKETADICSEHNIWLHVDAAYAGSAMIVPEMRNIFDGIERADSFVVNPHKWLFTPFDLSTLYLRDKEILKRAFSLVPEFLKTQETVTNQMDYGISLGRRFRSLKLWFVLRYFGREGLIGRIRQHCRLARTFASWVEKDKDWEVVVPVNFALVCFRAAPLEIDEKDLNEFNEQLMNTVNESGMAYLSHTKLNGNFVLRLSIGSLLASEKHLEDTWEYIKYINYRLQKK